MAYDIAISYFTILYSVFIYS